MTELTTGGFLFMIGVALALAGAMASIRALRRDVSALRGEVNHRVGTVENRTLRHDKLIDQTSRTVDVLSGGRWLVNGPRDERR